MKVRHKSPPRRRRPRDPRIAQGASRADGIAEAHHAPTQTPGTARMVEASRIKDGVRTWHAERPRVIDARTGRPPRTTDRRYFGRGVTISHRAPEPRTAPVSVHAR